MVGLMRNFFVVILVFFSSISASLYSQEKIQTIRLDLSIIELTEKEKKAVVVEQSVLYSLLVEKFAKNGITVKNDPNLPYFTLHIKSLPSNGTIATFLLGSFYQEATILPNKRDLWAITWYQTSIIIGSREKYTTNIELEAANIINSFILDYRQKGYM